MKTSSASWIPAGLVLAASALSPLSAGERVVLDGYAESYSTSTGSQVRLSLSPLQGTIVLVPTAPADRAFIPPGNVRWEIEFTGETSDGIRTGNALRTSPDDFMWPAGEEISPNSYHGQLGGMLSPQATTDPLGVEPGSGIPDYDQDGIPDSEDAFPGDPKETTDTDGDGMGDNADPDDDNDGVPDTWEIAKGTNPLVNDAAADPDRDGFNNLAEYEAGTEPLNRNSFFRISRVEAASATTMKVYWNMALGRTYSILHAPTLGRPEVLQSGITTTTAGETSVTIPRSSIRDFYYLQVTVTPSTNP